MLKHPHTGANYHEGEAIITHLNYALGPDGWDWEWLDQGIDAEADEVWVLGKLTARFVMLDPSDESVITRSSLKSERGWQGITRSKTNAKAIDLGNNYKAAATDALKRCARLLGVGLDAWAKGGAIPQRQTATDPKPLKTKLELVADVQRGLEAARAAGLQLADVDTAPMDRVTLIQTITGLADMVREARASKAAG
jgi:hypothetical protein